MRIGVPRETAHAERRVALVPEAVAALVKQGLEVRIQRGAGEEAQFPDSAYEEAGGTVVDEAETLYAQADVLAKVQKPTPEEARFLRSGAALISLLQPASSSDLLTSLAEGGVTALALELIPRIARAQSMDVLSSQSSVAGYRAALIGATSLGRFFPLMMTAAGTLAPARVLVMGTGVAGLQAIATARRLGAVVQGYDIRPTAKEQVESLGATFLAPQLSESTETAGGYARELAQDAQERERRLVHAAVAAADVVITTALIPGRPAPILITTPMVADMRPGSVIVDAAAEAGGNCEVTEPGQTLVRGGVTIHGPLNLPSALPVHASQMFARNVVSLLRHLLRDDALHLDFDDEITRQCCVAHRGRLLYGSEPTAPQAPSSSGTVEKTMAGGQARA